MLLPVFVLLLVFTGAVDPDVRTVEIGAQVMTFSTKEACDAKLVQLRQLPALATDTSGYSVACVPLPVDVDAAKAGAIPTGSGPTTNKHNGPDDVPARVMKDAI